MNEKLNIQNLIDLLAEKHGIASKDAEDFVKTFFALIEEGLEQFAKWYKEYYGSMRK